ncbi:hypothetical protein Tco_1198799 [Tanacetum coccineum]
MPVNAISLPSQQTTKKMIEEEEAFNLCSSLSVKKPPVQTMGEYRQEASRSNYGGVLAVILVCPIIPRTLSDLDLYLLYNMFGEEPAPQMAPIESPKMVSIVKLPILKNGEYTLWSMRMEQYLTNTDYALWQVILNGDGPITMTKGNDGVETEVPPKTAQALLQRQRERKAKIILVLAIPDEYQLRFHGIQDAKSL